MASSWQSGLPRWSPYVSATGEVFSLAHLNPRRFTLDYAARGALPAVAVEIRVGFMSHTFARKCAEGEAPHPHYSRAPHDCRTFCPQRYALSHELPRIVESFGERRCYESNTEHGNHFVIEGLAGLPMGVEYWIFLQVDRIAPEVARVRIRSAYAGDKAKPPRSRSSKSMRFRELVARTLWPRPL